MKNKELAAVFKNIADLLEIKDEKPFRVLSYRRAARTIKDLPQDVEALASAGELIKLPGIGKGTVEKVEQYLAQFQLD